LQENGIANNRNWSIANTLEKIEKYNGTGYFHKEVNSHTFGLELINIPVGNMWPMAGIPQQQ
jgi:hypothetical protein